MSSVSDPGPGSASRASSTPAASASSQGRSAGAARDETRHARAHGACNTTVVRVLTARHPEASSRPPHQIAGQNSAPCHAVPHSVQNTSVSINPSVSLEPRVTTTHPGMQVQPVPKPGMRANPAPIGTNTAPAHSEPARAPRRRSASGAARSPRTRATTAADATSRTQRSDRPWSASSTWNSSR